MPAIPDAINIYIYIYIYIRPLSCKLYRSYIFTFLLIRTISQFMSVISGTAPIITL